VSNGLEQGGIAPVSGVSRQKLAKLVLRDGRLAGILSMRDLLALEIDERDEAINLLNAYVHYIPADLSPTRAGS
jgi:hypothetical protein